MSAQTSCRVVLVLIAFLVPLSSYAQGQPDSPSSGERHRPTGRGERPATFDGVLQPLPDSEGAIAGSCPGTGDCCVAHGNPGCNNTSCCDTVCFLDDFCCFGGWNADCVSFAQQYCGGLCSGDPCPGAGDCCTSHSGTGCQDASCCESVCAIEPSCCEAVWDASCAVQAQLRCGALCAPPDPCPGSGECCVSHDSAGCVDEACCDLVCGEDPFCYEARWDSLCTSLAHLLCVTECAGVCPSSGDCCTAHAGPGCDEPSCCQAVCAEIPTCCTTSWTTACAARVETLCVERCGGTCPAAGDCCTAHAGVGCEDRACCQAVCDYDFFCCTSSWDANCVTEAGDFCPSLCGTPSACGASGDCCNIHAAPGCEDQTCCQRVCRENAGCCSTTWSSGCVTLAQSLCGPVCGCPQIGDFDANGLYNLRDVAAFQRCFTGPDSGPVTSPCDCGDVTGDGDVDLLDLRAFVQILTR